MKKPKAQDDVSRRSFVAAAVGAGLGVATDKVLAVVETDVAVKTADGICDAVLLHPAKGKHPGVLIWTDSGSLRPSFREIGRRLASAGYVVLIPNHLYRSAKAPVFPKQFDPPNNPADMEFYQRVTASHFASGAVERDTQAFIAFLEEQRQVNRKKKFGVIGYCLGGGYVLKTAAAFPERIGAGVSFHGGGFFRNRFRKNEDSPHLAIPKIKARLYLAVASDDDQREPEVKDQLKVAFAEAKVPAEIEVYPNTPHGWCVPEGNLTAAHKAEADRAWSKLLALYKAAL